MATTTIPFTVRLPRELKRLLKTEAAKRGQSIQDFTPRVIKAGLRSVHEEDRNDAR